LIGWTITCAPFGLPRGGEVEERNRPSPSDEEIMTIFEPSPWSGRMLSIFRIVAGLVFISFGTMKLFGYPPSPVPLPPFSLTSQLGIAGLLETFGGLAIVLGLFTRPVAFVLAAEMAVAYFEMHFPLSFFPTINNGTPAIMYCLFYLYLAFAGAGEWSLDARIARSRGTGQMMRA
jgi:putative oxidoreductase